MSEPITIKPGLLAKLRQLAALTAGAELAARAASQAHLDARLRLQQGADLVRESLGVPSGYELDLERGVFRPKAEPTPLATVKPNGPKG